MSTASRRTIGLALGLLGLLSAASASSVAAATFDVRSTLSPEVIGIDEVATFSVEVRGGGLGHLRIQVPTFLLDNFEIAAGPFQAENMSFVNGTFSRSFRFSWELKPLAVGRARIRAVSVRADDAAIDLPDREVRVQQEPTRPPEEPDSDPLDRFFGGRLPLQRLPEPAEPRQAGPPRVILRAEVTPAHPYVGEETRYVLALYAREDVSAVNPRTLPSFQGFWVRDIPQPPNLPTTVVDLDGVRYGRVVLLEKALFPLRAGTHTFAPAAADAMVRTLERTFFGPPIDRPEELQLHTQAVTLEVQPLPPLPTPPPGFRGTVGRMALAATLQPQDVRVGEAATLTLTLSGEGNLQGVAAPALHPPPGLRILPPQQQGSERLQSGSAVRAVRTWTYAVIAETAGSYRLAADGIPFFDPATRGYRVATAPGLALAVRPAPAAQIATAPIAGPKPAVPVAGWRRALPWGLAASLGAAFLLFTWVRRRRPGVASAAQESAARRLEERLREAESHSRPRQAAAHIEEAWRGFLAAGWEIPEASPTPRWQALLEERGADREAARELGELGQDLQYLRQAPQLSAAEALQGEALARSRQLMRRLRGPARA